MSKSSRMLSIIPLILLLPFIVDAKDCDEYYSCKTCVNANSWSGDPCRWCPKDNECHAVGSVWPWNKCSASEVVKDEDRCSNPPDGKDCDLHYSCSTCVNANSWTGTPCRWCPKDNECHGFMSALNPCPSSEDIKDDFFCSPPSGNYDPSLAEQMLLLSSIAYDFVDPHICAQRLFGSNLQVTAVASRECNGPLASVLPWDIHCSGFVGFSTQHQAIVVSFRGSNSTTQVFEILTSAVILPTNDFRGMGNVQQYFDFAYETLWPKLKPEVKRLQACLPSYDIWVTGHSLGGAISSLASSSILLDNIVSPDKLISYTFGMPRVGKKSFADSYSKLVKNRWRVTNKADAVTIFPTIVDIPGYDSPFHHGIEVYYHSGSSSGAWDPHRECNGYPLGEDPLCSLLGRESRLAITEPHKKYFGIAVGDHCKKFHVKERMGVWNPEFLANETTVYRVENGSYIKMHPHELEWKSTQCPTTPTTPRPPATSSTTTSTTTEFTTAFLPLPRTTNTATKTAIGEDHQSPTTGDSSKPGTTIYILFFLSTIIVASM